MIKAIQRETRGAVTAMEQGVLQVEAGTEEAATAAAQLSGNAEELQRLVRQFKL